MPAQWTAEVISKLHLNNITRKQLAEHLGLNSKYVLAVLNGKRSPKGAQEKFNNAVNEIIEKRKGE